MTDHTVVTTVIVLSSIVLYLPRLVCTYYSDCYEDFSNSIFLSQPCNVTLYEGEDTEFNCTPAQRSGLQIATWIIDGKRYYYTDFLAISTYNFDLYDNSLTIHNTSRNLDGSSYQCVINRQESRIAYLTVLYALAFTSQRTTVGVSTTPHESSTPSTPTTTNPTSGTVLTPSGILNSKKTQKTSSIIIASSVGITCLIVTIIFLSVVIILTLKFHNVMLQTSTETSESFTMDRNELYGQLSVNRKHTLVSLTRNQLYEHRHNYLSSR